MSNITIGCEGNGDQAAFRFKQSLAIKCKSTPSMVMLF